MRVHRVRIAPSDLAAFSETIREANPQWEVEDRRLAAVDKPDAWLLREHNSATANPGFKPYEYGSIERTARMLAGRILLQKRLGIQAGDTVEFCLGDRPQYRATLTKVTPVLRTAREAEGRWRYGYVLTWAQGHPV